MSCDCNTPLPSLNGSTYCCPTSFCHDKLLSLSESQRMNVVGVVQGGKCLNVFPRSGDGVIVYDGKGGGYLTRQPKIAIPYLKSYLVDQNGDPIYSADGTRTEDLPPGIESLIGAGDCGLQWRITGQKGKRQKIIWDGCKYVHQNDDDLMEEQDLPSVNNGQEDCSYYPVVFIRNSDGTLKFGFRQTHYRYPGEIIAFGGPRNRIPGDCLACDGAAYDPAEYPDLFENIGYHWGRDGDFFNVPKLEGLFLRGVDHGQNIDPDAASRTAIQAGGAVGDTVGSLQQDAFQCHEHSVPFQTGAAGSTESIDTNSNQTEGPPGLVTTNGVFDGDCGTVRFTDETRPKNAGVEFLIYAGCRA